MPRTATANQRIRQEQREKILEAARHVFARKGRSATMADVAAQAGVSQGLAYRYFTSKEALLDELVEQTMRHLAATMQRELERTGRPGERLFTLVTLMVESRRDLPEFFQMLEQVLSDESMLHRFHELVQTQSRIVQEAVRQLIVAGQAKGTIRAVDPDQLVRALFVYLDGLARGYTLYGPDQFKQHFPECRDRSAYAQTLRLSIVLFHSGTTDLCPRKKGLLPWQKAILRLA